MVWRLIGRPLGGWETAAGTGELHKSQGQAGKSPQLIERVALHLFFTVRYDVFHRSAPRYGVTGGCLGPDLIRQSAARVRLSGGCKSASHLMGYIATWVWR